MEIGYAGLSVPKAGAGRRENEELGTDLRKDVFRLLEQERADVVHILQEDIGQLISIASMQLSGNNSKQVNAHLSLALAKLRALTFELKPDILQQFSLNTALTELFNQRFSMRPNRFSIDLQKLPQGMSTQMEIAIFRLVQKTLNHVATAPLAYFSLQASRIGQYVYLKSRFELEPSEKDITASNYCETSMKAALSTLVYLFHSKMYCQILSDNQMEFLIVLDENQFQ